MIAGRYNSMMSGMKTTPYWIEAPTRASTGAFSRLVFCCLSTALLNACPLVVDIERWSDRFKPRPTSAATAHAALRTVHAARQWDKDLLPPSVFEAVLEKKPKTKATKGTFPFSHFLIFSLLLLPISLLSILRATTYTDRFRTLYRLSQGRKRSWRSP
jgi:hypothetical protein